MQIPSPTQNNEMRSRECVDFHLLNRRGEMVKKSRKIDLGRVDEVSKVRGPTKHRGCLLNSGVWSNINNGADDLNFFKVMVGASLLATDNDQLELFVRKIGDRTRLEN